MVSVGIMVTSKGWMVFVFVLYVSVALMHVICDDAGSTQESPALKPSAATNAESIEDLSLDEIRKLNMDIPDSPFEAEVSNMMKLIINSLYKNKEIFLRELISNSADALDKIRFLSIKNPSVLDSTSDLSIRIKADKEAKTISVVDTGIGMTKAELEKNLGTIAKSGTAEFFAKIAQTDSSTSQSDLIGQFGVGFYSSFLVADRVTVVSKSNDDDQYIWESDSKSFKLAKDPRGNTLKRGTEITLHLKQEADDFLMSSTLRNIIKKYSQFITFPIYTWESRTEEVTEPKQDDEATTSEDATVEEEKKPEGKKVSRTVWDWTRVNDQPPVWTKKSADVTKKEYEALFKALTGERDELLSYIHFEAEGEVSFKSILYLPKKPRPEILTAADKITDNIKLYVRRVFIVDNDELLPRYLAFIFGIVDSDDLPLNVSRETLQQSKLLKLIRKKLIKKIIEMISKLSQEEFDEFWAEYATHMKLFATEDQTNRAKVVEFLRYKTSYNETGLSSFKDYIDRMKPEQKEMYYIVGEGRHDTIESPFAERIIRKGFEVIYMTDPVDEFLMQALTEVRSVKTLNLAKGEIDLTKSDKDKEAFSEYSKTFQPLMKWLMTLKLNETIKEVHISQRLTTTPCALIADKIAWSGNYEKVITTQPYIKKGDPTHSYYTGLKKILEINPRHPLIKELNERVALNPEDKMAEDNAILLFEMATLRSGYSLPNSVAFAERIERIMRKNLNVDLDEPVEDEVVEEIVDQAPTESSFDIDESDENVKPAEEKPKEEL